MTVIHLTAGEKIETPCTTMKNPRPTPRKQKKTAVNQREQKNQFPPADEKASRLPSWGRDKKSSDLTPIRVWSLGPTAPPG